MDGHDRYGQTMEVVELKEVSEHQWIELGAEEPGAWGGGPPESLEWREKERYLGLCEPDGRLLAVAETVLAEVSVEGSPPFEVVGIGGVFVNHSDRGRGLMRSIMGSLLELAATQGPQRAMLFCLPRLAPVYATMGFAEIADPVWADQPAGRIAMPMVSMWIALHGRPGWPSGRADLQGLPF
jgi:predicted GNAT family N-acyltransferase